MCPLRIGDCKRVYVHLPEGKKNLELKRSFLFVFLCKLGLKISYLILKLPRLAPLWMWSVPRDRNGQCIHLESSVLRRKERKKSPPQMPKYAKTIYIYIYVLLYIIVYIIIIIINSNTIYVGFIPSGYLLHSHGKSPCY